MKLKNQLTFNKNHEILCNSLKKFFANENKIFIHPIYLINNPKLFEKLSIIESPNFDNSKLEIIKNTIYIKEHTFTGLRGTLSLNITNYINHSDFKNKILNFLSLFSGRLFELRNKYIYKYLPSPESYVKNFFNNCCGFNNDYLLNDENIHYKYLLNKNKNIYNLKVLLENYTKSKLMIFKYYRFFENYTNVKQNKQLSFLYLGNKFPTIGLLIKFYVNNYLELQNLLKIENNINYILEYFTKNHVCKYYLKKESLPLKLYMISRKINFI